MKKAFGTLFLIPTPLGKTRGNNSLPPDVLAIARSIGVYVVENLQSARRFLQWIGDTIPEYEIEFYLLNKQTPEHETYTFLKPLLQGKNVGLISEAGCPAVADPGSALVKMAHLRKISVKPLVGPSSILLALMASGFNGQSFAFHGYLPIEKNATRSMLQQLEGESIRHGRTQIFMEAPHRNNELLKLILEACKPETRLCIACQLTTPHEYISSKTIKEWTLEKIPDLHKKPTIFVLYGK